MGVNAGAANTTGSSNFIMSTNAGVSNTTGTANFFLGDNAGVQQLHRGLSTFTWEPTPGNGSRGVNGRQ